MTYLHSLHDDSTAPTYAVFAHSVDLLPMRSTTTGTPLVLLLHFPANLPFQISIRHDMSIVRR